MQQDIDWTVNIYQHYFSGTFLRDDFYNNVIFIITGALISGHVMYTA